MSTTTCTSCRAILRARLRHRIAHLEFSRREYHPSQRRLADRPSPLYQSWYGDTLPPSPEQLDAASTFFRTHPPRKLWTANEWRKKNDDSSGVLTPEVAFLGRSNVGKSSLLNAILLSPGLNRVGPRPGKTTTMHAWTLSATDPTTGGARKGMSGEMDNKITVLDMPGYGHASRGDWGSEIIKYLRQRKQLRRTFVLLDAMHGIKDADVQMLKLLRAENITHQIVASKCDRLGKGPKAQAALENSLEQMKGLMRKQDAANAVLGVDEILAVGSLGDGKSNRPIGLHQILSTSQGVKNVQWAILRAAGLDEYALNKSGGSSANKDTEDRWKAFQESLKRFVANKASAQGEMDRLTRTPAARLEQSDRRARSSPPRSRSSQLVAQSSTEDTKSESGPRNERIGTPLSRTASSEESIALPGFSLDDFLPSTPSTSSSTGQTPPSGTTAPKPSVQSVSSTKAPSIDDLPAMDNSAHKPKQAPATLSKPAPSSYPTPASPAKSSASVGRGVDDLIAMVSPRRKLEQPKANPLTSSRRKAEQARANPSISSTPTSSTKPPSSLGRGIEDLIAMTASKRKPEQAVSAGRRPAGKGTSNSARKRRMQKGSKDRVKIEY